MDLRNHSIHQRSLENVSFMQIGLHQPQTDRIQRLRQELTSLGLLVWDEHTEVQVGGDGPLIDIIEKMVQIIFTSRQQIDSLKDSCHSANIDAGHLRTTKQRLKQEIDSLERDIFLERDKTKQLNQRLRTTTQAFQSERNEVKRLQGEMIRRESQFRHEIKKREKEAVRIKERINQLVMNKTKPRNTFGIDVLNSQPFVGQKRSVWHSNQTNQDNQEQLYMLLIFQYKERFNELLIENKELRSSLAKFQDDLLLLTEAPHLTASTFSRHRRRLSNSQTSHLTSQNLAALNSPLAPTGEFSPAGAAGGAYRGDESLLLSYSHHVDQDDGSPSFNTDFKSPNSSNNSCLSPGHFEMPYGLVKNQIEYSLGRRVSQLRKSVGSSGSSSNCSSNAEQSAHNGKVEVGLNHGPRHLQSTSAALTAAAAAGGRWVGSVTAQGRGVETREEAGTTPVMTKSAANSLGAAAPAPDPTLLNRPPSSVTLSLTTPTFVTSSSATVTAASIASSSRPFTAASSTGDNHPSSDIITGDRGEADGDKLPRTDEEKEMSRTEEIIDLHRQLDAFKKLTREQQKFIEVSLGRNTSDGGANRVRSSKDDGASSALGSVGLEQVDRRISRTTKSTIHDARTVGAAAENLANSNNHNLIIEDCLSPVTNNVAGKTVLTSRVTKSTSAAAVSEGTSGAKSHHTSVKQRFHSTPNYSPTPNYATNTTSSASIYHNNNRAIGRRGVSGSVKMDFLLHAVFEK